MNRFPLFVLIGAALALPSTLPAQLFSTGIIGGVPFSDAVNSVQNGTTSSLYKSSNFTIGPSLRVGLPAGFRVEVDALYRPSSFQLVTPFSTTSIDANQWRFPILLQYRVGSFPILKPFVEAGGSWNHLANVSSAAKNLAAGSTGRLLQSSSGAFVLGAGVDAKIPFVRLSAELRYTRQGSEDFQGLGNLNQAEFLLGIRF